MGLGHNEREEEERGERRMETLHKRNFNLERRKVKGVLISSSKIAILAEGYKIQWAGTLNVCLGRKS